MGRRSGASWACGTRSKAACARPAIASASRDSWSMPRPGLTSGPITSTALDDIFDLQDRVTASVAGIIEPKLRHAEIERARRKPTESLDAYDLYLRALAQFNVNYEGNREALRLLRRAIEIDPQYAAPYGLAPRG